jgi:hypothetical protein
MSGRMIGSGWLLLAGALAGLAVGIVVGATTEIPFAPEAGALIGLAAAWLARRYARPS